MWTIKNRYIVLIGALLAQVTIAGLYAWSIFGTALQTEQGWTAEQILWPYALAQFVFALSTLWSGPLVDRKGPRLPLLIGAVLYGSGVALSYFATEPWMLYITYGILAGAGVGFVYVCPLATLVKWFPGKRGMITGLSVGVFGGGSMIFQRVISALLANHSVAGTFLRMGLISFVLIFLGALLTNNPADYVKTRALKSQQDFTTAEMIKTPTFILVWMMFLLAVIPGLLVLGAAKNIGLEVAGLESVAATSIISILAISNAGSRLVSGTLSDRYGTLNVLQGIFVITIVSLFSLSFLARYPLFFYFGMVGVAVGYGGFLALFPTFTNQTFGSYRYASNYAVIFQAYGIAALSGIFIKSMTGSFTNTFILSAGAACIALGLSFMLKKQISGISENTLEME